jgi:formylglycine-generating enzyme required for sulfatase activity
MLAPGVALILVQMPAGSFLMGSGDALGFQEERPQRRVTFAQPFWIGRTVLTQAQWQAVAPLPSCAFPGADRPVDSLTWDQAVTFLDQLNRKLERTGDRALRLPSEVEWEYACRAGTDTQYSFVDSEAQLPEHGWFTVNGGGATHPVAQLTPNPWGLFDMHGNVWQWVQDPWNGDYRHTPQDGRPAREGGGLFGNKHVLRGGAWYVNALWCPSRTRARVSPDLRFGSTGFRVAASR